MADHDAKSSSYFIYDVFLSFRGFTRYGFTDRLYHALIDKGIITFRDDENLRVGDRTRPTLLEAIKRSRMSIAVLCQNYASSTWCLDELVRIMECSNKGTKRLVLPIFYHVQPSDVRHQKNQYKTDMMKHEDRYGKDSDKVTAWRLALSDIADLSGKHCTENSYESEIIKNIVEEISEKLPAEPLYIKHPIGFDSRFEVVESLLDIESHDTICMLIIYGDGEIDKTTFVGELYNKVRHQFEVASFLANVCEKSKESINGLEDLQMTLLSEMQVKEKPKIGSTLKGSSEIRQSLRNKRVLLVLDDVDSIKQLDSLAGGDDWFGPGSRIIITTRIMNVLDKYVLDGVKITKYCIDEGEFEGMEGVKSNHKQKKDIEEDIASFVKIFNDAIKQLKEEDSCTSVVSIIGMGGLGKTTLARRIYNSNEVKKLFSCCAWVVVSKDYKAKELLLSLLHYLELSKSVKYEDLSEEELENKVQEYLNEKKYLIVLDDLWEPEVWDEVESLFPNNRKGSKILITSRNDEVANYTNSKSHYLPFLNEEESWKLFCRKVFRGEKCLSVLEPIGRSMVGKCGGLPLAIVTLAGIVAKKRRLTAEWLRIKRHVLWHLAKDKSNVMGVLKLSYDSLPQRLKPCYIFFGMYPEDYEIPVRQLIQLWIAEELIQPEEIGISDAPELEYIAEEYLNDLVDRNLVQVASIRSDGGVKKCRVHDLHREICISESKANEALEIRTGTDINFLGKSKSCRLSLRYDEHFDWRSFAIQCDNSRIHSLMCCHSNERQKWNINLKSFNSARILDLGKWWFDLSMPRDLNTFIHLRYLRVGHFLKDHLDSICTLPNLETLDISMGHGDFHLPSGIWKLKQLRHLRVSNWDFFLPDMLEADCLPNLQTLQLVTVERVTMSLMDSGRFPKLRKLGLRYSPRPVYGRRDFGMKDWEGKEIGRKGLDMGRNRKGKIAECKIGSGFVASLSIVLDYLQGLHRLNNLHRLKLWGFPDIPLDPKAFPSNLTKITMRGSNTFVNFNYNCMATLGCLTNLRVLKVNLENMYSYGSVCCVAGSFPTLEVFQLEWVDFQRWILEKGAMPCLQHLVIDRCSMLNELPEQLWSLTALLDVLVVVPNSKLTKSLRYVKPQNGCELIIKDSG